MVLVNKILNVLVLILAVAACIAAVLLHERRIELRERADVMADVINRTANITDGIGETSSELNSSSQVNESTLDWESFHKARDEKGSYEKWIANVKTVEDKLQALHSMKIDLADALIKTAGNLEYQKPEGLRASLNSAITYGEFTKQIHQQSEIIRKRDDRLASALGEVSNAIKKAQAVDEFKVLSDEERLDSNIGTLLDEASQLYGRSKLLAAGLADLKTAFTADLEGEVLFKPSWNSDSFASESPQEISDAFTQLTEDLKTLNGELYTLKIAKKTIDKQVAQLTRQKSTIEDLNIVNDDLANEVGALKVQVSRLNRKIASMIVVDKNPVHVAGTVIKSDDRYNFIIINRGKNHGLILGATLLVHKDGKFICKVKTSKILENRAVCEVLPHGDTATTDNGLVPLPGAHVVTISK